MTTKTQPNKSSIQNRIASLSLYVHDLAAARTFYVETLGLPEKESMGDYGFVLGTPDVSVVVLSGGQKRDAQYPGGAVLGLPTSDVAATRERLVTRGAKLIVSEPERFPLGTFIVAADPSGNSIELLQFNKE